MSDYAPHLYNVDHLERIYLHNDKERHSALNNGKIMIDDNKLNRQW